MSPILCLEAVKAAVELPFAEGMDRERELFVQGLTSDQSRGLIHAFFGEREVSKIPGLDPEAKPREVKTAAIIGAGTMGGGIAMCFANAGIPVTVLEQTQEALDKGLGVCRKNYENTAKKGRLTMEQVEERMALFTGTTDINDLADVDIVIEAVFENMDVKKDIFTKLDAVCKEGCVLATNTSTLDINQIANVTKRPQEVIGMHFFNPVHIMKLGAVVHHDPHKHDHAFAAQFLSTVMEAEGDIRIAMRNLNINVDWWDVERKGNKGKAQGKGSKSDAKGSGKRPASTDDHARAQRRRRD